MERKVHFYSGPGLKLAGILELPDESGVSGKRPGIVVCHAGTGTKEIFMPEISKWLVARGYVVLRFDYRGFGESEGPECRLIPFEQVEDIRSAMSFMEQQDEVDEERIGLWGPSSGGANVSYTAGIDTRVKCMVSVSSMGDMGRWQRDSRRYWEWRDFLEMLDEDRKTRAITGKSRRVVTSEISLPAPRSGMDTLPAPKSPEVQKNELSLESVEAMIQFRPETVVDRISPRAAMWIYTAEDTVVPVSESRSMYRKAREPKKLVTIEGFKHYELYHGPGLEQVMTHSTEWFDAYLGADWSL
jgi:alpha-beta hydrolase superfamily lysophospholipase